MNAARDRGGTARERVMNEQVRAVVMLGLVTAALIPTEGLSAQGRTVQDTSRQSRVSAEELHRQRREALAAERSGLLVVEPPRYGSAVVGVPGAGRGTATGVPGNTTVPGVGEVAVVCTGVMRVRSGDGRGAGAGDLVPGTFRGDCRPADGSGRGGAWPGAGGGAGGWEGASGGGYVVDPGMPGSYGPINPGGYGHGGYGYGPYAGGPGAYSPYAGGGVPLTGGEYYRSPFGGLVPLRPYGWPAGPAGAYAFSWPGSWSAGECVRVQVTGPGGGRTELLVGLQSLGLADPSELDLSIDQRLSRGEVVTLMGLDGRVLRLLPGVPYEDLRVLPCGNDTR